MIPDSIKTFGEAVRWARERKRFTMHRFASLVGVSAPFVCDVEHNRRHPEDVAGWAKALDVPTDELLSRRLYSAVAAWVKDNPELADLLKRLRPARQRCWCPWCRALPREERNVKNGR